MKSPNHKTSFRNQTRRATIGTREQRNNDDGLSPAAAKYIDAKYKAWLERRGYAPMTIGRYV